MKTILHLERKFTSPTETFIINQVNTLTKFKVIVGTIKNLNNFKCNKEVISVKNLSRFSKNARYLSNKTLKDLYNNLSDYSIDLIHTHYLSDALYFYGLVKKFNVPKICSGYGYDISSFPRKYLGLMKHFYKLIFKQYDYFLAMSEDMKKDMMKLGCPESKIIVHYYGTDTARFFYDRIYTDNYGQVPVKILTVGTVEPKKAQYLVVEALLRAMNKYSLINFEYHIVGDGPDFEKVKNMVRENKLENKVFLYGYIPHYDSKLVDIYKNADIFIHPSQSTKCGDKEGIPGTIVEAMASGLPVISTYHAGIPYIIENEKEGILIKEGDVESLAEALYRLVKDPILREKLGRNAQLKAINNLDLMIGTRRLEKIYETVLNGSKIKI